MVPLINLADNALTPLAVELFDDGSDQQYGVALVTGDGDRDRHAAIRVYRSPDSDQEWQSSGLLWRPALVDFRELRVELDARSGRDITFRSTTPSGPPLVDLQAAGMGLVPLRASLLDALVARDRQRGVVLARSLGLGGNLPPAGFVVLDVHRWNDDDSAGVWWVQRIDEALVTTDRQAAEQAYLRRRDELDAVIDRLVAGQAAEQEDVTTEDDAPRTGGMFVDYDGEHVPMPGSADGPVFCYPGVRTPAAARALHLAWREWQWGVTKTAAAESTRRLHRLYEAVRDAVTDS